GADVDPLLADGGHELLQLAAGLVVDHRPPEALELTGLHVVHPGAGPEPLRREVDVAAAGQGGAHGRLVRRLVLAEAHVAVGPEDLALAELGRQLPEELLHGRQHLLLVDRLVVLPVGLGVVGLQPLVELDGLRGPTLERHVGGGYSRPSTSETARSATVQTTSTPARSRS